jgi:hypothetical protein
MVDSKRRDVVTYSRARQVRKRAREEFDPDLSPCTENCYPVVKEQLRLTIEFRSVTVLHQNELSQSYPTVEYL